MPARATSSEEGTLGRNLLLNFLCTVSEVISGLCLAGFYTLYYFFGHRSSYVQGGAGGP